MSQLSTGALSNNAKDHITPAQPGYYAKLRGWVIEKITDTSGDACFTRIAKITAQALIMFTAVLLAIPTLGVSLYCLYDLWEEKSRFLAFMSKTQPQNQESLIKIRQLETTNQHLRDELKLSKNSQPANLRSQVNALQTEHVALKRSQQHLTNEIQQKQQELIKLRKDAQHIPLKPDSSSITRSVCIPPVSAEEVRVEGEVSAEEVRVEGDQQHLETFKKFNKTLPENAKLLSGNYYLLNFTTTRNPTHRVALSRVSSFAATVDNNHPIGVIAVLTDGFTKNDERAIYNSTEYGGPVFVVRVCDSKISQSEIPELSASAFQEKIKKYNIEDYPILIDKSFLNDQIRALEKQLKILKEKLLKTS